MVTKVKCPTCKTELEWGPQSPFRPFCSKRCQLIDLGEWRMKRSESRAPSTRTCYLTRMKVSSGSEPHTKKGRQGPFLIAVKSVAMT